MPKLKTAAEGAAEERRLWMRKVRDMFDRVYENGVPGADVLNELRDYGKGRTKRNEKPGGLGKK